MPDPVANAGDLDPAFWRELQLFVNRLVAPWHLMVDGSKLARAVDRLGSLGVGTIAPATARRSTVQWRQVPVGSSLQPPASRRDRRCAGLARPAQESPDPSGEVDIVPHDAHARPRAQRGPDGHIDQASLHRLGHALVA